MNGTGNGSGNPDGIPVYSFDHCHGAKVSLCNFVAKQKLTIFRIINTAHNGRTFALLYF
jgi:hypothetical protein